MNVAVPIRLIAGIFCFLYLILPIVFVSSIRQVLGLTPIMAMDYLVGTVYSVCTFIIILMAPRQVVICADNLPISRQLARAIVWLTIFASVFFFASAMRSLDTLIYFDKAEAHLVYEELSAEHELRLKYNILLCIFLLASIKANMRAWGGLFFLTPTLFEVVFSKHNYITHLLTYLFILAWNSRVSRSAIFILFSFAVAALLGIRFAFYADFQSSAFQSLAAMLGEFVISWQSIPSALAYDGSMFMAPTEWYSDVISKAAGLQIGLAGNPVAEMIFYFGNAAGPLLVVAASGFVLISTASRRNLVGGLSMLVTTYYMRDCFRTGWSLGFSVYLKALIIFSATIFTIRHVQRAAGRQSQQIVRGERQS